MKQIVIVFIFLFGGIVTYAQQDTIVIHDAWQKMDSVKKENHRKDTLGRKEEMIVWDTVVREPGEKIVFEKTWDVFLTKKESSEPRFKGHWRGYYFGFVNFGNTDYSKYGGDDFLALDWANSFAMQFNSFQFSLPVNLNFGFVTGLGLEYQRLRFERDITVRKDEMGQLQPVPLSELGINRPKRSTFKTLYLTLPVLMEYQFQGKSKRVFFVATGFMAGLRLHSKTKIVYNNEKGTKKVWKDSGTYGMAPVKVDCLLKMGLRGISLWGSYTLTKMFNASVAPGVHPYTIGFGFTL